MEEDLDFESLESKIDYLLKNEEIRKNIEKNVSLLENDLTLESIISKVENFINKKIDNINSYVIQY